MSLTANHHIRLLERRVVAPSELSNAIDLGAFRFIEAQIRVIQASSTSGTVILSHSATTDEGSFSVLGTTVSLSATTNDIQSHSNFLRYVRWETDGSVDGTPIVVIDLVVKN